MEQAIAYSTLAITVGLAVSQPRVGRAELRITPGMAAVFGVAVLLATRLLHPSDLITSARIQWRPLLSLTCIMVMTGVVAEVGVFERLAHAIEAQARRASAERAFDLVFLVSALTPALLNNDAGILLLTPVVVAIARRLFPGNDRLLEAFAFAVFLAPGVAPFILSNPMNMIVAEVAGLEFASYAVVMGPISLMGALLTFGILRLRYRKVLATSMPSPAVAPMPPAHPAEKPALGFLLAVFLAYPVMAAFHGPLWSVALAGAIGCAAIARMHHVADARALARHVSFDILAFLWGVFLVVSALRGVGVVDRIASFYGAFAADESTHLATIGFTSALGSALVDNHPMAILNMMALHDTGSRPLLASLIGGDIGPRLLPIGSLAGLLWMDLLRRRGVVIRLRTFVGLGTTVLVPTLVASLAMLIAMR